MVAVACGALLAAGLFWLTVRQAGADGASPLLLGLIPAVLLVVALPLPVAVWEVLGVFRRVHTGAPPAGLPTAAATFITMDRTLLLATIACIAFVALAMALQSFGAGGEASAPDAPPPVRTPAPWVFGRWWLAASSLLIAPVAALVVVVQGVPRMVVGRGPDVARAVRNGTATMADLQHVAALVTVRSIVGVAGGVLVCLALLLAAMGNVIAVRPARADRAWTLAGWTALAVVGGLAAWNGVALASDLTWLESIH